MDMPVQAIEQSMPYFNNYKSKYVHERTIESLGILTSYDLKGFALNMQNSDNHMAQQDSSQLPEYRLEEVVITEKQPDQILEPVTMTSYAIEEKTIENIKPSSLADILNTIVSVRASTGQKNETAVFMRGLKQNSYVILIDGEPLVYSPYDRSLDFQQIPADNIAKVIVSPNAPALYGPNTMGGAINIITKKGEKALTAKMKSEFSNNNYKILNYNVGGAKQGFNFFSSAEFRESDGFKLSNGKNRDNADYKGKNISLKLGQTTYRYDFSLLTSFIRNNNKGLPVTMNPADQARYWRFRYWNKDMVGFNGQYNVSSVVSLKGRFFYEKFKNLLDQYKNNTFTTKQAASTFDDDAYGSSIELHIRPSNHNLAFSLGGRRDDHNDQSNTSAPWYASAENIYTMGFQDISTFNNLILNVGTSFDFQKVIKAQNVDVKHKSTNSMNPEIGLAYVIGYFKLRTNLARKTNFANLQNLTGSLSANPDLKPEKANKFEAGIDYARGIQISGSYFNNHIQDRIDRKSKNDPYENINKAVLQGVETTIARQLSSRSTFLQAGYTYIKAQDQLYGNIERPMPYVPAHNFRIGFSSRFLKNKLNGSLFLDVVSKIPYQDRSGKTLYIDPYQDAEILLSFYPVSIVEIYLKVSNIFNRNIIEEIGFPQSGRRFFAGIALGR